MNIRTQREEWQCPYCGRKYNIPATAKPPERCPKCRANVARTADAGIPLTQSDAIETSTDSDPTRAHETAHAIRSRRRDPVERSAKGASADMAESPLKFSTKQEAAETSSDPPTSNAVGLRSSEFDLSLDDSVVTDTESPDSKRQLVIDTFRWIGMLPGALACAVVAVVLFRMFAWLGSSRFGDETWFDYLFKEIVGAVVLGVAWVYCAAFIAPKFKAGVAITFAGVMLFVSGMSAFALLISNEWFSMFGLFLINAGSIGMAIQIVSDPSVAESS